jgi:hypothetical protein
MSGTNKQIKQCNFIILLTNSTYTGKYRIGFENDEELLNFIST